MLFHKYHLNMTPCTSCFFKASYPGSLIDSLVPITCTCAGFNGARHSAMQSEEMMM